MERQKLMDAVCALGARRAAVVPVSQVTFEPGFRTLCEQNSCGRYGKSWMCPPHVGEIGALIARAGGYRWMLVYQTISPLEDSFDIEGMLEAGRRMNELCCRVRETLAETLPDALYLGAGGCRVCEECAYPEPCRAPERACASLEAYGVSVSQLAELAGMRYTNGENTVTYFGAVLFS